ncbi:MAG: glycosyltransferase [Bacteroidales bacterium]|nr:glycosyltransferase [Bacteroidales bacterium]
MAKITISCGTLSSGGAERVLSILSKYFTDYFEDVEYIMWTDAPVFYKIDDRVRIVNLQQRYGCKNRLKELFAFRKHIKRNRPDLILSFLTPVNIMTLIATSGLNIKTIVAERNDPHCMPDNPLIRILRDVCYLKATGILTQTEYAKSYFKQPLLSKTHVIYNPVDMSESEVGSALSTPKKDILISVGRLIPQKNQKMMIDAFKLFHREHESYKLIIYGKGSHKATLSDYIHCQGLENDVILAGVVKDIWPILKDTKVFLLSSLTEGMSNAMLEALCLGLPVISTKVAGATELIRDGYNGYLVNMNDVEDMSEKMAAIVDDESHAYNLGKNAATIYKSLNEGNIGPQWIEYIKSILN